MGTRRQSRELALQILYQCDMRREPLDTIIEIHTDHFSVDESIRPFARLLAEGVRARLLEIDDLIVSLSENWSIERMSVVDRNILRMGTFEILYCDEIPAKVSINEAVDLGKTFGSDDSGAFINGILQRVMDQG